MEKKYGLRFGSDLEMVDHILDKGIDRVMVSTSKIQALKEKLGFGKNKEVETKENNPSVATIPQAKPKTANNEIMEKLASMEASVTSQIQEIEIGTGLVLSEMQLELDHFTNKMQKAVSNLDYNNGEKKEEVAKKTPTVISKVIEKVPEKKKDIVVIGDKKKKTIEMDGYEFDEDELD